MLFSKKIEIFTKRLFLLFLVIVTTLSQPGGPISAQQFKGATALERERAYTDTLYSIFDSGCGTNTSSSYGVNPGKLFAIGDSLLVGMDSLGKLGDNFNTDGWSYLANANEGRSITRSGSGKQNTGSATEVINSSSDVGGASVILVVLGTNQSSDEEIKNFYNLIKQKNTNAQVFWLSVYPDSVPHAQQSNAAIAQSGAKVITNNVKPDGGDGIHYTASGYKDLVTMITGSIKAENSESFEEHRLPATSGGLGLEEEAEKRGNKIVLKRNGGSLTFSPKDATDTDINFYITMRWRYAKWAWNGTAITNFSNKESFNWFNEKTRKIIVTNKSTRKSIVVAALESGPAPWTGTSEGKSNPPNYWSGYIDGTPQEYKGRVAGLSPAAYQALGAKQRIGGHPEEGDEFEYAWSPDQSLQSGTILDNGQSTGGSAPTSTTKRKIVLDPGHDGSSTQVDDPESGLHLTTTTNNKERADMWRLAQSLKPDIEALGYEVVLTKNSETDTVQHSQRAKIANDLKADVAISLHTDGTFNFGKWGEVYPQEVGRYRTKNDGTKYTFKNQQVADISNTYSDIFVSSRNKYENGVVVKTFNDSFLSRGGEGKSSGDISNVQLLSNVPWVYLEAGDLKSDTDFNNYRNGILDSIKSLPLTNTNNRANDTCSTKTSLDTGSVVSIAKSLVGKKESGGQNCGPEINDIIEFGFGNNNCSSSQPWCAAFVRYVFDKAGKPLGTKTNLALGLKDYFKDNYVFYTAEQRIKPQPGDLYFKERTGGGHVGIVVEVNEDGSIVTVDGNSSNQVLSKKHMPNYASIPNLVGFGRMADKDSVQEDPNYTPPTKEKYTSSIETEI